MLMSSPQQDRQRLRYDNNSQNKVRGCLNTVITSTLRASRLNTSLAVRQTASILSSGYHVPLHRQRPSCRHRQRAAHQRGAITGQLSCGREKNPGCGSTPRRPLCKAFIVTTRTAGGPGLLLRLGGRDTASMMPTHC
ncbi:unnamed protein product [Boreogadus saida]